LAISLSVNPDDEKLPYQRGIIYAFYFDNQSGWLPAFRDFLPALLAKNWRLKNVPLLLMTIQKLPPCFLPKAQITDEVNKYL
jgi:hypothetical protein